MKAQHLKSGIQQVLNVGEMITASAVGDMAIRANAGNMLFATGGSTERMRINSAGAIKFNAYDSTNNTGTPTYLLGTDASGNIVKTLSFDPPTGTTQFF